MHAHQLWTETDGLLSFEWVLLLTLLGIGIVSGVAAVRDAVIDEFGDTAQAMMALDGSYLIDQPLVFEVDGQPIGGASDSQFIDMMFFTDCGRGFNVGQGPEVDN